MVVLLRYSAAKYSNQFSFFGLLWVVRYTIASLPIIDILILDSRLFVSNAGNSHLGVLLEAQDFYGWDTFNSSFWWRWIVGARDRRQAFWQHIEKYELLKIDMVRSTCYRFSRGWRKHWRDEIEPIRSGIVFWIDWTSAHHETGYLTSKPHPFRSSKLGEDEGNIKTASPLPLR